MRSFVRSASPDCAGAPLTRQALPAGHRSALGAAWLYDALPANRVWRYSPLAGLLRSAALRSRLCRRARASPCALLGAVRCSVGCRCCGVLRRVGSPPPPRGPPLPRRACAPCAVVWAGGRGFAPGPRFAVVAAGAAPCLAAACGALWRLRFAARASPLAASLSRSFARSWAVWRALRAVLL